MPTDTDVTTPPESNDSIESLCYGNPLDAEGATDDVCGNDAVVVVFKPAGHRTYLCHEHAAAIARFGDDVFAGVVDGDERPPTVDVCKRCNQFTPRHRLNADKICDECEVEP